MSASSFFFLALLFLAGLTPAISFFNDHLVGPLPYVDPNQTLGESYAGHFNVNVSSASAVDRAIFYWYFPAQNGDAKAPIIIWFQGGPGSSSMLGLLYLNGPLRLNEEATKVYPASITWNKDYAMLFIDNPVGVGFSYVEGLSPGDLTGFVTDQEQVGRDIYLMLLQFYQKFPLLAENDLYITGESYAGKYCPGVADYIRRKNEVETFKINLKGVAIGNGLTDPKPQVNSVAEHAYNLGLIDRNQKGILEGYQQEVAALIDKEDWLGALDSRNTIYSLLTKWTGGVNYYDVRRYEQDDFSGMDLFLNLPEVRESLNVGGRPFYNDPRVYTALTEDIMKSTASLFPALLENYKVLIYTGQWDIRDGVPATLDWLALLDWKGREEYLLSERAVWKVNGNVAGFAKQAQNLTDVTLVNSSHFVPMTTPEPALDMISKWINNQPFGAREERG